MGYNKIKKTLFSKDFIYFHWLLEILHTHFPLSKPNSKLSSYAACIYLPPTPILDLPPYYHRIIYVAPLKASGTLFLFSYH